MSEPISSSVGRIVDANANRAREALRVMEDYARFVLSDAELSERIKETRHGLSYLLEKQFPDAILHRNILGDVGRSIKTTEEVSRADVSDVVIAAGKRLSEALRTLEEFIKTSDPDLARRIERLRYRGYDIEQQIAITLRPSGLFANVRLYVILSESCCKIPWLRAAEEAIAGGADCIQLREKSMESGELLRRAKELAKLCRAHKVLCIINDHPGIAVLSGADGVHLGQGDLPAREARKILGREKIIGVSTHNLRQAKLALRDGADYLGVGPVFKSSTKPRNFLAGLEYAQTAAKEIRLPMVAIGGITVDNVDLVTATGIGAVAVTAAVLGCKDVRAAARRLKKKLSPIKKR